MNTSWYVYETRCQWINYLNGFNTSNLFIDLKYEN